MVDVSLSPVAHLIIIICIEKRLTKGGKIIGAFLCKMALGIIAVFLSTAVDAILALDKSDVSAVT